MYHGVFILFTQIVSKSALCFEEPRASALKNWGWCFYPALRIDGCFGCAYAGFGCGVLVTDGVCEGVKSQVPDKKCDFYEEINLKKRMTRKEKFGLGMHLTRRIEGRKNRFVTLSHFKPLKGWYWTNFVKAMRFIMRRFEYAKVVHTVNGSRQHIHFVYRGEYMDVHKMGEIWKDISGHGTVWMNVCDRDDHILHYYMSGDSAQDKDVKVRWSFSKKWAPRVEQLELGEKLGALPTENVGGR